MPAARPNILFIMDDQHRFDYLGCAGADFVRTPHLDRLAARGTRFTHCLTNAPVCAPARVALAAGLQPRRLGPLGNNCMLPLATTTYMQRLRNEGYRVAGVGKFDLAKSLSYNGICGDRPLNYAWGFTEPLECEGKMHAGANDDPQGPYGQSLKARGLWDAFRADYKRRDADGWVSHGSHDSVLPTDAFEDAFIGERAAQWIEQVNDDFPWHMFVSFVGPHDPFDPPTEYAERYRHADMPPAVPASLEGKPRWIQQRIAAKPEYHDAAFVAHARRQYCAAIELIDDQVGRILGALEERGQLDNTFILFSSDHGEMLGDHGLFTKQVGYEASVRVPLVVAGPGIAAGVTTDTLVELIDLNATICEMAGLAAQEAIDAKSLLPVLQGRSHHHRDDAMSELARFRLIRTQRYKLIETHDDVAELYDLEEDPDEQHNLARERSDLLRDMHERLEQRQQH